jgi:2-dehydro-3-deoxyphosphogluconate aldolase / (4S)-4-hydroxy-2-oxoglutarate aldolase
VRNGASASLIPGLRFVPTGGIAVGDLPSYLARPSVLAVGGSWVAPRALLRARRFDDVTRLAAEAVAAVAAARATEAARA